MSRIKINYSHRCLAVCVVVSVLALYVFVRFNTTSTALEYQSVYLPIWPIPKVVSVPVNKEGSMMLSRSPDFTFKTPASSKTLKDAIKRYEPLIFHSGTERDKCSSQAVEISTVLIVLWDENEALTINTNYDYELTISTETNDATIIANSPFGAIYGLETLSQLFSNQSCLPYPLLYIQDKPLYRHRGLMLDVGRRIAPKPLVLAILDSLSYLKMNVLHFHLNDFCRFSIQSEVFPELTADLKQGQFYTKDDIREIVGYAQQRGIRVIPEIELPGHAKGLKSLDGDRLQFCDGTFRQIYNDPEGKGIDTLKRLFAELVDLFPDQYMHMGSDETFTNKKCTLEGTRAMETQIAKYLLSLERIPIAWEEALFGSKVEVPGMVFQSWKSHDAADRIIKRNYDTIESTQRYFYMDIVPHHNSKPPWIDIAPKNADSKRVLGGELAMWSDHYCETRQCWDETDWKKRTNAPVASWMYKSEYDAEFSESMMGMIWPNGIPAAGSFWNYNESLSSTCTMYKFLIQHVQQVMISRGIKACPIGCKCDEVQRCGVKYHGYDSNEL